MRMTDEIPGEFTDEERWLKFFPKHVFIVLLVGVVITIFITKLFMSITGHFVVPLILCIIGVAIVIGLLMIKRPSNDVMRGGGQSFMSLIFRKRHRIKNAKIYVKGYGSN